MADELVTLEQAKSHLKLEADDASQDGYVTTLRDAALRGVELFTGRTLTGSVIDIVEADRSIVVLAVLVAVTHWFEDRDAGGDLPAASRGLVRDLRRRRL